jgi:glycosyltransferase involved in cell wall biosynthesis
MAGSPWGGSEELWSRTALNLARRGFTVTASVVGWESPHRRVLDLASGGIDVRFRPTHYSLWERAWRKARSSHRNSLLFEVERLIDSKTPELMVLSDGTAFPQVELLELCAARGLPFVTIGQANFEGWWPTDDIAERYRVALPRALRCFFVSRANWQLAVKQIGRDLPNAEVIWNPFNVAFDAAPPFPTFSEKDGLLLACVGRLHPPSKGQDILLEALANPVWADRNWRLHLYGDGNMKESIERMVRQLDLSDRVVFGGYVAVEDIWARNQVLVMPSRFEGLPLAIVEAMLCGRTVVATQVAGNSEILDDGVSGFLASAPTVQSLLEALERLWLRRTEVEQIGQVAKTRIRQLVPPDPVEIFSKKMRQLARQGKQADGAPLEIGDLDPAER